MGFKVNDFKTYEARCDISLGMADPNNPPKIKGREPFEFDGFTLKLKDGRVFENAEGVQGMIDKGFVKEIQGKRIKKVHKPKVKVTRHSKKASPRHVLFQELDEALEQIEDIELESPEEDPEDDDFSEDEDSEEEDDFEEDEDSEEEEDDDDWEDYESEWDEDEDGEEEEENDWGTDLGHGITMRNQARNVDSGRDLGSGRSRSLEQSATASVGSTSTAWSTGGAQVGSGGGVRTKVARRGEKEVIGFENVQTTRTVMRVPDIGVGNTQTAERRDVSEMSRNSIERMENRIGQERGIPVGHGAKIAKQLEKAKNLKAKKLEKILRNRSKLLEKIREEIPKFKWNLQGDPTDRFERAMVMYEKSTRSERAKRNFEAVLKYELPEMRKRIQKEISFRAAPRR